MRSLSSVVLLLAIEGEMVVALAVVVVQVVDAVTDAEPVSIVMVVPVLQLASEFLRHPALPRASSSTAKCIIGAPVAVAGLPVMDSQALQRESVTLKMALKADRINTRAIEK